MEHMSDPANKEAVVRVLQIYYLRQYGFLLKKELAEAYFAAVKFDRVEWTEQGVAEITINAKALSAGRNLLFANIKDPNQCNATPGAIWYRYTNECRSKPTNQAQCQGLGGSWAKINNQDCCQIPNLPPACLTSQDTAASKEANQLKVLYWSET